MIRVLLDNCLDHRFGTYLQGVETVHSSTLGWERLSDVLLLRFAAEEFDVVVTVDANMPFQTNIKRLDVAVIILQVPTNRLADCLAKVPDLLRSLPEAPKGQFTTI